MTNHDMHAAEYTALSMIDRLWLKAHLWFHQWEAENYTRLIIRVRDEVQRCIAPDHELMAYTMRRIHHWNRANEIRARLGIVK